MVAPWGMSTPTKRIPTVCSLLSRTSSRSLLESPTLPVACSSASSELAATRTSMLTVANEVGVGVGGTGVLLGVGVSEGVGVSVGIGVSVGVSVAVGVSDNVGVSEGVGVSLGVGVSEGVGVSVGVSVDVAVSVAVGVSVSVGVIVGVLVGGGGPVLYSTCNKGAPA
jgi:hypothetical protein